MFPINYELHNKQPQNSAALKSMFSHGDYRCERVLLNKKEEPVGILHNAVRDIWMVQDGTCTVFFGEYAEALDYCRSRFCDLDGGPVRK